MEVYGKAQAPAALPPWKELTYTKKIRNWMTPKVSVKAEEKNLFTKQRLKLKNEAIYL